MTEHRRRLAEMLAGAEPPPRPSDEIGKLAGILSQRDTNQNRRANYHANRQTGPQYGDMWDAMHPMDKAALATAPIPGVGDVVGLAADARALYEEPSWTNAGMMALGAVPLVPAAGVLKRGADAADAASDIADAGADAQKGIRAYHGSPHDFDQFSLDAIGTGEGAQAYGHGLYFAEAEDVARSYRDNLSQNIQIDGKQAYQLGLSETTDLAIDAAFRNGANTVGDVLAGAEKTLSDLGDLLPESARRAHERTIAELRPHVGQKLHAGSMYEVNINADPDDFLDWDRPITEQPEALQAIAREADLSNVPTRPRRIMEAWRGEYTPPDGSVVDTPSGNLVHSVLTDYGKDAGANKALSEQLAQAGIPGIKYLDQGSRGAGTGSRNYVVFDANLVDIVRKYGIAAVIATPMGASMLKDYESRNGPIDESL